MLPVAERLGMADIHVEDWPRGSCSYVPSYTPSTCQSPQQQGLRELYHGTLECSTPHS